MPYFLALCSFLLGGGLLVYGFRQLTKARVVAGKNPMRIGSVRGGFFAFRGKVEPLSLLRSPQSGSQCVYYNVHEEEWIEGDYVNGKRRPGEWRTVRRDEQAVEFLLDDGTGKARVIPESAEWHLHVDSRGRTTVAAEGVQVSFGSRLASDHRRSSETYVLPGDVLHVVGQARPASGAARITISREDAPVFLITDKPKGDVTSRLTLAGFAACAGGLFFVMAPVFGLLLVSAMQSNFRSLP